MSVKPMLDDQMTIEEFLAFTQERPDGERWELIEGEPRMNPSPTDVHQMIVGNIVRLLAAEKQRTRAYWYPMLGIGTRVPISPNSLPQPDLFVKAGPVIGSSVTDDALVLFEVLSRSNSGVDQTWRRRVYGSVPNCLHYVTLSQREPTAVRYDRATQWRAASVSGVDAALALPGLGGDVTLPLAEVYRWTPLGADD